MLKFLGPFSDFLKYVYDTRKFHFEPNCGYNTLIHRLAGIFLWI